MDRQTVNDLIERVWIQEQRLAKMKILTWFSGQIIAHYGGAGAVHSIRSGLRHTYGVHAVLSNVPETRIKKWLGHNSLATTEIYLDVAVVKDRKITERMCTE